MQMNGVIMVNIFCVICVSGRERGFLVEINEPLTGFVAHCFLAQNANLEHSSSNPGTGRLNLIFFIYFFTIYYF
jgi:hypothetical protein